MAYLDQPVRFRPSRKNGSIFLGGFVLFFILLAILLFWSSATTSTNWLFGIFLTGGILACAPLPMLSYRLFGLNRAYYELDRNALTIHWGLRTEILPLRAIEWVRPAEDLTSALPTPPMALPGGFIGVRQIDGLGRTEYMADSAQNCILIAGSSTVFVISPTNPREFMATYYRGIEQGSLDPVASASLQPSFILGKVWDDQLSRRMLLTQFILGLVLALWVVIIITSVPTVDFAFSSSPQEPETVPSIRLILLPVVNVFVFIIDLIGGSFFFRNAKQQIAAYLIWGSGIITAFFLLISILIVTIKL